MHAVRLLGGEVADPMADVLRCFVLAGQGRRMLRGGSAGVQPGRSGVFIVGRRLLLLLLMARAERQGLAIERVGQIGRVRSRMKVVESELLEGQHARLLERHEVRGTA